MATDTTRPPEVLKLHINMVQKLGELFPVNGTQWHDILNKVQAAELLSIADVGEVKTMFDLFKGLLQKRNNNITYGEYTNIREHLGYSNVFAEEIIDEYTRRIHEFYKDVPILEPEKKSYSGKKGQPVILKCKINKSTTAIVKVQWQRKTKGNDAFTNIDIDGERYIGGPVTSPSLCIMETTEEDNEAIYVCQATNAAGTGKSDEIQVKITQPEQETVGDKSRTTFAEKARLTIEDLQGFIKPFFGKITGFKVEWELDIRKVNVQFTVKEDVTVLTESFQILIGKALGVDFRIVNVQLRRGCTIVSFDITGATHPLDESALALAERFTTGLTDGSILLTDETGNPLQIQQESIKIFMKETLDAVAGINVPMVSIDQAAYCVVTGDIAILKSRLTTSTPITSVTWFRIDNETGTEHAIEIDNEKYFGGSIESPSLVIDDTTFEDAGRYVCHAENRCGVGKSFLTSCCIYNSDNLKNVLALRDETSQRDSQSSVSAKTTGDDGSMSQVVTEKESPDNELISAAAGGTTETAILLLEKGADPDDTSRTMALVTPLHRAAERGDIDVVTELVRSGADLGATDSSGWTPLMYAVINDKEDTAAYLAKEMTVQELSVVDNNGNNVLHQMALWRRPWSQLIQDIADTCPSLRQQKTSDGADTCPSLRQQKTSDGHRPIDIAGLFLPENQGVYNIFERMEQRQQRQQRQQQQYTSGIADNVENPCNITITVVGHHGVGKSCFVRQLKQEYIPEAGPGSTDCADFYVNYIVYNLDTGFRQTLDENGELETGRQRLKRLIDRYRDVDNTSVQTSVNAQILQGGKGVLSASTINTSTGALSEAPVDAPVLSARKKTGIKQKLKQFFPKLPFRKKERVIQDVEIPQHFELTQEQKSVIEKVMSTEKEDKHDGDVKGYVTIYDLGGEKVFYNTHHCFMSSNMVFVLVFDVAMCLDPSRAKDGYEQIEFWLRNIATYAIDRAAHGKGTPPVILVGSHLDLVSENKEKQERMIASVLEKLYEKPELREIMETHVQEMFSIADLNDSTKNQDTYERVWKKIIAIAPLQSQWMKPVPARWVALEYELVRLKNEGRIILTYADLLEINSMSAVPLAKDEVMEFLMTLRFSGSFLCFDLHSKSPFIVLQPQWIINAFKAIITAPKFTSDLSTKQSLQWTEYEKSGVLSHDFIKQLWDRPAEYRFIDEEERLFIIMETLGLLTKPISVDAEVDYFIVPSILQTADPEVISPVLADPDTVTTVSLCVKFDNPFIPQAVWDKMIASCIHRFQRLKQPGLDCLTFIRRGFTCLSVDYLWNMIINCSDNAMKVTMFKTVTDHSVPTGTGIKLLSIIEFLFQRILELNHQSHLGYQFYLHNDFRFTANEQMVKVEDLRKTAPLRCYSLKGPAFLDRNDLYIWFKNPDEKKKGARKRHVGKTKKLPDRKLSFKEIGRVSRYIGSTYQTFFAELDCPVAIVEQEMEEHRHLAFRSRITKIFIHLRKTKADTGFQAIADAMSQHGMDPSMLVNILDSNRNVMFIDEKLPDKWLNKYLSVNDVPIIADHVDIKSYFNLFLELGFTPKTVDQFDDHYRNKGTRKKIIALLEAFIKETTPCPTVNSLLLAMQECDMDTEYLIGTLKPS